MIKMHTASASHSQPLKNSNKPAFGYNYETHKLITQTALKQVPQFKQAVEKAMQNKSFAQNVAESPAIMVVLKTLNENPKELKRCLNKLALNKGGLEELIAKYQPAENTTEKFINELKDGTMLPDLLKKETGFQTNTHFFFLPEGKLTSESFGKDIKKNNALVSFVKHITQSANTQEGIVPQETGMALHFLQDMTVPMHTQRANISLFKRFPFLGKIVDFFLHKNFESGKELGILARQEELAKNYKPAFQELKASLGENFDSKDLFMSNVKFSSQPHLQVARSNKKDWAEIQQAIFNRAVDSTVLFLQDIAEKKL